MRTTTCIFLALYTALASCTTYRPVIISVKNKNGFAITDASVQVSPMYFFNPTDDSFLVVGPYDILEPFPAKAVFGITDNNGEVALDIVKGNPSSLIVLAPNHQRWRGEISITAQDTVEVIPPVIDHGDLLITVE